MENLIQLISPLCNNGNVNIIEYANQDNYIAVLRLKLEGKSDEECNSDDFNLRCNEWVNEFSIITKTQWIVRKTLPKLQRLLFRKQYVCHHNSFNKVSADNRKRVATRTKAKECNALIDIKIKKITRFTVRNDPFLKEGWSAIIMIKFKHSHLIHVAEAYSYLRMSNETKEIFLNYFNIGMGPTAARNYHELQIVNDIHDDFLLTKALADSQTNPKEREIYGLYDMWSKLGSKPSSKPEEAPEEWHPNSVPSPGCPQSSTSGSQCFSELDHRNADFSQEVVEVKPEPITVKIEPVFEDYHGIDYGATASASGDLAVGELCRTTDGTVSGNAFCRLCLGPVDKERMISLSTLNVNYRGISGYSESTWTEETGKFAQMIKSLMPSFDLGLVYNPIMCHLCSTRLELACQFVDQVMESQKTIKAYKEQYLGRDELVICEDVVKFKSKSSDLGPPRKRKKTNKAKMQSSQTAPESELSEDDLKEYHVTAEELTNITNEQPPGRLEVDGVKIEDTFIAENAFGSKNAGGIDESQTVVKNEPLEGDDMADAFSLISNPKLGASSEVPNYSDLVYGTNNENFDTYHSNPSSHTSHFKES